MPPPRPARSGCRPTCCRCSAQQCWPRRARGPRRTVCWQLRPLHQARESVGWRRRGRCWRAHSLRWRRGTARVQPVCWMRWRSRRSCPPALRCWPRAWPCTSSWALRRARSRCCSRPSQHWGPPHPPSRARVRQRPRHPLWWPAWRRWWRCGSSWGACLTRWPRLGSCAPRKAQGHPCRPAQLRCWRAWCAAWLCRTRPARCPPPPSWRLSCRRWRASCAAWTWRRWRARLWARAARPSSAALTTWRWTAGGQRPARPQEGGRPKRRTAPSASAACPRATTRTCPTAACPRPTPSAGCPSGSAQRPSGARRRARPGRRAMSRGRRVLARSTSRSTSPSRQPGHRQTPRQAARHLHCLRALPRSQGRNEEAGCRHCCVDMVVASWQILSKAEIVKIVQYAGMCLYGTDS
mmetsp:Transcript_31231/g.79629  ORF Transcript_31231/g.79629 Transcript_31231/m.79629 type:complete len:408 (+) Transcript_31231:1247-2470(+)